MGAIVLLWMYRGVYDKFLLYWNGMGLRDFIIKDMGAGVYMGGRKGAGGVKGMISGKIVRYRVMVNQI